VTEKTGDEWEVIRECIEKKKKKKKKKKRKGEKGRKINEKIGCEGFVVVVFLFFFCYFFFVCHFFSNIIILWKGMVWEFS